MRTVITSISLMAIVLALGCASPERQEQRGFALPAGDADAGRQAFEQLQCTGCHQVDGLEDSLPGPTAVPQVDVKLGGLAMREPTDGELVTSIINPSHRLNPAGETERITSGSGSRMANLNEAMTVQQMIDLVAFLHERYGTVEES